MRFSIRREDRRNLLFGFVGLMTIMTAHAIMETARDTLFLTNLPATDLPRAYLAIALLAIVELKLHERVLRHVRDRRILLAASLLFGSLVTLGFWALLDQLGPWAPFGFYVWTGLLITVVLIEFWLLLGDAVTVTQAKRIFPAIAAGGVSGAMLGSLLAERLLRVSPPPALVLLAASVLAMAAGTAFLWRLPRELEPEQAPSDRSRSLRWLLRDDYLSRVLALVLFGTVALTVVDFVFKASVAQSIPPDGLGPFFARFYLGLNTVALLVQVAGAGWLLRGFGVHQSSALLPVLVFGGALGLAVGPVVPFAVALKAVDGSLRHTLHRSAVEVLYLPLDSRSRERAKGIVEVFGHRLGQALGSVLIIGAVSLGLATQQLAIALVFVVAAWLWAIFSTRQRYVELFRARLRHLAIDAPLEFERLRSGEDHEEALAIIDEQLRAALLRVGQLMGRRAALEHGRANESEDAEPLIAALRDEEKGALGRAFWLLWLQHPDENLVVVWRGLQSESPMLRAASVEVLEAVLNGGVREALLALLDVDQPMERRARMAFAALGESPPHRSLAGEKEWMS